MTPPSVPLRPAVAELPAYVPGARVPVGASAYKLSSNENPYPPLPAVLAAIADAAADANRYPDMYATELTEALGAAARRRPGQVVAGTGSVAVLGHVLAAVCGAGDEVVMPWRSFEAYPIAVAVAGAVPVAVPLTRRRPPGPARDGRGRHGRAPGSSWSARRTTRPAPPSAPDELETLLDAVPTDVLVVVDEAYVEFVRDPDVPDGVAVLREHRNVVVLRTFSKAYGLAGLRVGYAVARPRLAAGIRAVATPFGVSHVAQRAAVASLARDRPAPAAGGGGSSRSARRLLECLRDQGWYLPDSQANFVWLPLGERTGAFAADAARAGVLVRPFDGEGVRVSVGETEATDLLLDVTSDWVGRRSA